MEQRAWHQKERLDPAFPFRLWESALRSFTLHWHEFLEISYILKGTISIAVDGQSYTAQTRDMVIINSGSVHGFSDADPDISIIIFQFGLELFDQALIDLRDRVFQKLVFSRKTFVQSHEPGEMHQRLENLLLAIRQEYYNKEEGFRLAIKAKLYELALIFLREIPAKQALPREAIKRNYNQHILERVFSFIHGNVDNPGISLDQAAKAAALSKFYFTRFFKEQTGQTFHTYLSQVRINRAEEYLAESDLPVTDIAYLCGFASLKTFNRLFKTYTGTSPSLYRNGKKLVPL
jgi:AraC-like DNA-binding protein